MTEFPDLANPPKPITFKGFLLNIDELRPCAKRKGGGTFCGRASAYTAQNAAVQAPPGLDSEIWPPLPKAMFSN